MSDTLRFNLDIPASVRRGVAVPITMRVINTGPHPVELYLRGRTIAFDIVVENAMSETVWHRLKGAAIDASLQLRILQPSEELVLASQWNQKSNDGHDVPTGEYTVRASLLSDRPDPFTFPKRSFRITG